MNVSCQKWLALGATALALLNLASAAHAQALTRFINFDFDALGNPIADGTIIGEQYAAWGIHFEPNVFGGLNITGSPFATNTDMTATSTDWGFIDTNQPVPTGNLLGGLTGYLGSDGDPNFWIRLDQPVQFVSLDVYGDGTFIGNTTLYGFDKDLNLISQVFLGEYDGQETIELPFAEDYSYIGVVGDSDFGFNDAWIGIDNIKLSSAPEPSSLALGCLGLVGLLSVRRMKGQLKNVS